MNKFQKYYKSENLKIQKKILNLMTRQSNLRNN